jgi:hypothetical protein
MGKFTSRKQAFISEDTRLLNIQLLHTTCNMLETPKNLMQNYELLTYAVV